MPKIPPQLSFLLVDDDHLMRSLAKGFLRQLDCALIGEASNGQEALPILLGRSFDVLVFDWHMAPMSGLDLTKKVRETAGPNRYKPIIVLTAYTERKNVLAAIKAGASAVVAKPVSGKALLDKIALVLQQQTSPAPADARGESAPATHDKGDKTRKTG